MTDRNDRVVLTVDAVISDGEGRILVMERGTKPFKGSWVLPGGLIDPGETVEDACVREVEEEVGLKVRVVGLVGVYSAPGRDPRGSFVSMAFHAVVIGGVLRTTSEARAHRCLAPDEVVDMGFDHGLIVQDYRKAHGG
ncbi:MAG: NUDIX domain-containing protein [Flavobacteriales bacterium]